MPCRVCVADGLDDEQLGVECERVEIFEGGDSCEGDEGHGGDGGQGAL